MFRWRKRRERGASAVEFALVMLPLLYILFGLIQYGWYFYAMQTGTHAAGEVVRRMSVGDCQTTSQQQTLLASKLGAASTSSTSVVASAVYTKAGTTTPMSAPGEVGGGVELTVTFQTANFNFPFIPVPDDGKVTRTFFARVEDTSVSTGGCS